MKTRITILILLFTLHTMYVKAQIRQVRKAPVTILKTTKVKTLKAAPQKIKGTLIAPNSKHYFFTDKRYFRLSKENGLEKIANTKPNWKGIPDNIDAVFVNAINKKAYFFKGSKYNRWDFKKGLDNNELAISRFWKGVPNDIDAVTNHTNGKIYFFKGNAYYRYDSKLKKVDKSALISKNWKGVPSDLAAAFLHENGNIYFFKDNKYYRYNIKAEKVDKTATIGRDGWKELDFNKKNFTKKIVSAPTVIDVSTKNNIRLKVTLTRIKSVQARDGDDIADFGLHQVVNYRTKGEQKLVIQKKIKVGSNVINTNDEYSTIFSSKNQIHVKEGDEKHFINNSFIYEITPQEIADRRAKFEIKTALIEISSNSFLEKIVTGIDKVTFRRNGKDKTIAEFGKNDIEVNIHEVLDYLQNPTNSKYGNSYFKDSRGGKMHEYGAFGDVMWMKKGSNNSLVGHLEFGDNSKETYVRLYYRFELVD